MKVLCHSVAFRLSCVDKLYFPTSRSDTALWRENPTVAVSILQPIGSIISTATIRAQSLSHLLVADMTVGVIQLGSTPAATERFKK